jgi:AAA domain
VVTVLRPARPVTIGLAGTHSTGKTTFLDRLQGLLERHGRWVVTVGQLACKAQALGFPILQQHTAESTLWVITRGISEELEAGLTADVVLVDRPVPDALGYYLAALEYRGEQPPPAWLDYLVALTRHHAATYSLLLATRLDPAIPLAANKPRDPDQHFRALADAHIKAVLARLDVPWRPLVPHNAQAALACALEACGVGHPGGAAAASPNTAQA